MEGQGSLGSRLHRGPDGIWYSYAQWPSAEARDRAFSLGPVDPEARKQMAEHIAEELPALILESVSDFMVLPSGYGANPSIGGTSPGKPVATPHVKR